MRARLAAAVLGGALCLGAAAPPPSVPRVAEKDVSLFLIGDAGVPVPDDPVLAELGRQAGRDPARSLIVFLGDNIYPRGLPAPGRKGRADAERRLDTQIDAARAAGASTLFVPGNHDWADRDGGWNAVLRQAQYIAARGGGSQQMAPAGGCPGPVVRDVGERLRLVALDTEWWLHDGPRPVHPTSSCPEDSEGEVLDALTESIRSAGERRVVVVGHHPLASGGTHAGHFGWKDHVFPLRAHKPWLWIPLPGLGSSYPLARRGGITNQDFSGELNRRMREALSGVFAKAPPLAYAAGHEHNLQVLKGQDTPYLLVSGAGAFGHLTRARSVGATLFAAADSGFMRIDVGRDGEARLGVVTVPARDRAAEAFARRLD